MKTTWHKKIGEALERAGETWGEVEFCTLTEEQLRTEFDDGHSEAEGAPFTLWTRKRVYFPVEYDGSEWASSVPRYSCDEATGHQG